VDEEILVANVTAFWNQMVDLGSNHEKDGVHVDWEKCPDKRLEEAECKEGPDID
jgi:hypothetical protein